MAFYENPLIARDAPIPAARTVPTIFLLNFSEVVSLVTIEIFVGSLRPLTRDYTAKAFDLASFI